MQKLNAMLTPFDHADPFDPTPLTSSRTNRKWIKQANGSSKN